MKFERLNNFLETKFIPIATKIGENKYLQSIRDGLLMSMPFIMIGSIFLILTNLPIPGYSEMMSALLGENWKVYFSIPARATFDILAIFASVSIAYHLAKVYNIDPLVTGLTSLATFIISTPLIVKIDEKIFSEKMLDFNYSGSKGLFVAIVVAIVVTEISNMAIKRNWIIKMPDSVPAAVARSFNALIPSGLSILIIWGIRYILSLTSFDNLHNLINLILGKPLSLLSGSLIGLLIGLLIQQLLWSVGLHGSSILMAVLRPPFMVLLDENRVAFEAGKELPNIINLSFYELWIQFGGSGTTLGLALTLLFLVKSKQLKNLGRLAIIPSIFNINEPLSFGIPIIMNPIMFIPWILSPLVAVTVTYFAMASGLVAKATGVLIPWTTPGVISGILATNSITGGILQIIIVIITGLIYYPFIKAWDKEKLLEEAGEKIEK